MLQTAFVPSCMTWASVFEWQKRLEEGRESVRDNERYGRSRVVNRPELIGQKLRVMVTMLRFLGSSGRDSLGRGQQSSNRVNGIFTQTIHQSTTPSLSQTFWPRWASRQFLSLPIFQTLLPVTFAYSLSLQAVVMWQLRWKRLWRGHWHPYTRVLPWGLREVVGTVQQVHCSRRRLLRRGLEFHVCIINKSAHTKKKSLENYLMNLLCSAQRFLFFIFIFCLGWCTKIVK